MPSGNQYLPRLLSTEIYGATWRHYELKSEFIVFTTRIRMPLTHMPSVKRFPSTRCDRRKRLSLFEVCKMSNKTNQYNTLSMYCGNISLKISREAPRSSPVRARNGVSFVNAKSGRSCFTVTAVLCVLSCYRWNRCIKSTGVTIKELRLASLFCKQYTVTTIIWYSLHLDTGTWI